MKVKKDFQLFLAAKEGEHPVGSGRERKTRRILEGKKRRKTSIP